MLGARETPALLNYSRASYRLPAEGLEPSSTDSSVNLHQDNEMGKKMKRPTEREKATVINVMKEMDKPRLAASVRQQMIKAHKSKAVVPSKSACSVMQNDIE